jgi:hypothetical protein
MVPSLSGSASSRRHSPRSRSPGAAELMVLAARALTVIRIEMAGMVDVADLTRATRQRSRDRDNR